tara:strand:- start:764 stop:976 length:213 start_codon:yes stop_codon:yes gene_type:complete
MPQYEISEISIAITRLKAPSKRFEIKKILLFLKIVSNSETQLNLSSSSGLYVLYKIAKIRDPSVKTKNNI